jgi:glycerophosphoryl diester phosphodiesterase
MMFILRFARAWGLSMEGAYGAYRRAAGAILFCGLCGGIIMACAQQKTNLKAEDDWRGKYPIIVTAHRGFSGQAPENTPTAFRAAIAAGADMIELDVHLTRDNEVVVIHDDTLERTTNGKGNVAAKTLAELKSLDAGSWFDSRFAGERIPTLAEVLEIARNRILVNIELKKGKNFPYTMEELADRTLAVVEKAGMTGQILFSSFDPAAVNRIKEKAPRLPIALIVDKPWEKPEDAGAGTSYPTLNCRTTVLNEENIRRAHTAGIRVHVWTVNTKEAMEKFIALGIDGIITNHPDSLIDVLKVKTAK